MNDFNLPEIIPVGAQGWKKRQFEIIVLETVKRATKPQSGWGVFQKLNKKKIYTYRGKEICVIMYALYKRGYLEHMGFDRERDSIYKIPTKKEI